MKPLGFRFLVSGVDKLMGARSFGALGSLIWLLRAEGQFAVTRRRAGRVPLLLCAAPADIEPAIVFAGKGEGRRCVVGIDARRRGNNEICVFRFVLAFIAHQ